MKKKVIGFILCASLFLSSAVGIFSPTAFGLRNPFVPYESIDDVKNVLSFSPAVPEVITEGYKLSEISSIDKDFLQIVYKDNIDNRFFYRMARGTNDISGDYNIYKINKRVAIGDLTVTMRGNKKISSAIWSKDGFAFSLYSDVELDEIEIINVIKNIK